VDPTGRGRRRDAVPAIYGVAPPDDPVFGWVAAVLHGTYGLVLGTIYYAFDAPDDEEDLQRSSSED